MIDMPMFNNGGGLVLAVVVMVLMLALAALADARKPRCHICGGRTRVAPDRIVRTTSGRHVLLCRVCHRRVRP